VRELALGRSGKKKQQKSSVGGTDSGLRERGRGAGEYGIRRNFWGGKYEKENLYTHTAEKRHDDKRRTPQSEKEGISPTLRQSIKKGIEKQADQLEKKQKETKHPA